MSAVKKSARAKAFGICALAAMAMLAPPTAARAAVEAVDKATKTALSLDVHPGAGRTIYIGRCATCHGPAGFGDPARGIPALAGQRFAYVVRQLADFSGDERESAAMHQVVNRQNMRAAQSWVDVAAYVSRLPANPTAETGDGSHAALGRGIFQEQCASCHQLDAGGDQDGLVPSLRGQNFSYLVTQLRKLAQGGRHNADEDLVRFLRGFDAQEIEGVADYLSRQHEPGRNHQVMRQDGTVVD